MRRELRTLTDDDRERYLSALATVYHTRDADGKRQYGSMFTSGEWFARWHLGKSGEPRNDEYVSRRALFRGGGGVPSAPAGAASLPSFIKAHTATPPHPYPE